MLNRYDNNDTMRSCEMTTRYNCWEVMKCGREPEGAKVDDMGVCPATQSSEYDGLNGGQYAGRFCWAIAGTYCGGKPQGTYATKLKNCLYCPFFKKVNEDEGRNFVLSPYTRKPFGRTGDFDL